MYYIRYVYCSDKYFRLTEDVSGFNQQHENSHNNAKYFRLSKVSDVWSTYQSHPICMIPNVLYSKTRLDLADVLTQLKSLLQIIINSLDMDMYMDRYFTPVETRNISSRLKAYFARATQIYATWVKGLYSQHCQTHNFEDGMFLYKWKSM